MFLSRIGRLLIAVCALAAIVVPASPALADPLPPIHITFQAGCNGFNANMQVLWTVSTQSTTPLTVTVSSFEPAASDFDQTTVEIVKDHFQQLRQAVRRGAPSPVRIAFHVTGGGIDQIVQGDTLPFDCGAPQVPVLGTAQCDPATGVNTVTWSLTSPSGSTFTTSVTSVVPVDSPVAPPSQETKAFQTIAFVETVPDTAGSASIVLTIVFDFDPEHPSQLTSDPVRFTNCARATTAPANPPPTSGAAAPPGLPVTGRSLTGLILAAAALLGGGAILLVLARRRRLNVGG